MSKCCEKKVFKCEDMDGVGKIFVRTNATLKAEAPIRFKTDSGYVQETTFEKGVDLSIDETAIKVDLSKYPTKEEVDKEINRNNEVVANDISLVKDWVSDNYTTKQYVNSQIDGFQDWVKESYPTKEDVDNEFLAKNEAEQTYLKKSDAKSGNIEYINKTYFDVSTNDARLKTDSGLIISFKKYAEKAVFNLDENPTGSKFRGIYSHALNTFEIKLGLYGGEIDNTFLNGIVNVGESVFKVMFIFETLGYTKFSIEGTVEKIK